MTIQGETLPGFLVEGLLVPFIVPQTRTVE